MDFRSGLTDVVVASTQTILSVGEIQQSCVFAFHALEQRRLGPARHQLLNLLHVVLRSLQSVFKVVNLLQYIADVLAHACQQRTTNSQQSVRLLHQHSSG